MAIRVRVQVHFHIIRIHLRIHIHIHGIPYPYPYSRPSSQQAIHPYSQIANTVAATAAATAIPAVPASNAAVPCSPVHLFTRLFDPQPVALTFKPLLVQPSCSLVLPLLPFPPPPQRCATLRCTAIHASSSVTLSSLRVTAAAAAAAATIAGSAATVTAAAPPPVLQHNDCLCIRAYVRAPNNLQPSARADRQGRVRQLFLYILTVQHM